MAAHADRFDLSDSDEDAADELVAATQVAASVAGAAYERVASSVDTRVRCAICTLDVSSWSIQERAVHMNACLDAMSAPRECICPTCGRDLTDYNEQRRLAHANLCLDRLVGGDTRESDARGDEIEAPPAAAPPSQPPAAASGRVDAYSCVICGLDLTQKDLSARIRHVKQCGQRFGVRPSDVAALQPVAQEGQLSVTADECVAAALVADSEAVVIADDRDAAVNSSGGSAATNAFAIMMRASSASTSVLSDTIGRVGQVVSNAFDVLMKGSKTHAVAAATGSSGGGSSFRPNAQATAQRFNKKRRVGGTSSSSSWGHSSTAGEPARRRPCPDFKRIKGTQPSFIVDGFQYASKALSSVYFLTHFHSDHYTGLDKSFDCGVIYCNAVTAALVVQELRIDSKWVHPVPMNTPVTIHDTQVTFMDANHCPGAVLILFRLKNGRAFLHTGDFRYHPSMLSYAPLQRYVPPARGPPGATAPPSSSVLSRLDGIYLDTTYADPKYAFPTQETAIAHALELVAKHTLSDKTLFLFGSYSIGKERLFMEVAATYQRKVCVSKAKLKFLANFGWADNQMRLLTTETGATNLHVVPMQDLKMEHLEALLAKHHLRFREIVAFRPTGWTFSKASASLSTCRTDAFGRIRIYGVPYSEHSSFAELAEFVRVMDPHEIIPTVNCHNEKAARKQVDALRQVAFNSISTFAAAMLRSRPAPRRQDDDGGAQVLSLDNPSASSAGASSRPGTSSGRAKPPKVSEFRQFLEQDELPLAIMSRRGGERRVVWTASAEQLDVAHLLPVCLSGLQESLEPYPSFAFEAAMGLLEAGRRDARVLAALPPAMSQLKSALGTREPAVVHRVLRVLQQLAVCDGVGEALGDYYRAVLPLCNILQDKHLGTGDPRTRALVADALETLEAFGRDDAHVLIQQYVPTFQSCSG
ncbi:hypothetical protein PybrP1_008394 [[Pythium] brassicae (nom. inval.)]|nr:hypothetical protein PybrP1_008394 [[Pythium] brassicae (nom. inval.)]